METPLSVAAMDQFDSGLRLHCQSDVSRRIFMATFQQSMRKLEHFREHKFEAILDEQGTTMERLEEECSVAQTEVELLRSCVARCNEITDAVAHTLIGGFLSPLAVADLQSDVDAFGAWINTSVSASKHMCGFRSSVQTIVSYLRTNALGYRGETKDVKTQTEDEELCGQMTTTIRKLHALRSDIDGVVANACTRETGFVESELDGIAACVEGLVQDVHQTERQLKRMQHDTLSQMYSCHEVARLELEQKQLSQNLNDQVSYSSLYWIYCHLTFV